MLAAVHPDPRLLESVVNGVRRAVVEAVGGMHPFHVTWASALIDDIATSRDHPQDADRLQRTVGAPFPPQLAAQPQFANSIKSSTLAVSGERPLVAANRSPRTQSNWPIRSTPANWRIRSPPRWLADVAPVCVFPEILKMAKVESNLRRTRVNART